MKELTEWKPALRHDYVISWEQQRTRMKCSVFSRGLMLYLFDLTSRVQYVNTKHSLHDKFKVPFIEYL